MKTKRRPDFAITVCADNGGHGPCGKKRGPFDRNTMCTEGDPDALALYEESEIV